MSKNFEPTPSKDIQSTPDIQAHYDAMTRDDYTKTQALYEGINDGFKSKNVNDLLSNYNQAQYLPTATDQREPARNVYLQGELMGHTAAQSVQRTAANNHQSVNLDNVRQYVLDQTKQAMEQHDFSRDRSLQPFGKKISKHYPDQQLTMMTDHVMQPDVVKNLPTHDFSQETVSPQMQFVAQQASPQAQVSPMTELMHHLKEKAERQLKKILRKVRAGIDHYLDDRDDALEPKRGSYLSDDERMHQYYGSQQRLNLQHELGLNPGIDLDHMATHNPDLTYEQYGYMLGHECDTAAYHTMKDAQQDRGPEPWRESVTNYLDAVQNKVMHDVSRQYMEHLDDGLGLDSPTSMMTYLAEHDRDHGPFKTAANGYQSMLDQTLQSADFRNYANHLQNSDLDQYAKYQKEASHAFDDDMGLNTSRRIITDAVEHDDPSSLQHVPYASDKTTDALKDRIYDQALDSVNSRQKQLFMAGYHNAKVLAEGPATNDYDRQLGIQPGMSQEEQSWIKLGAQAEQMGLDVNKCGRDIDRTMTTMYQTRALPAPEGALAKTHGSLAPQQIESYMPQNGDLHAATEKQREVKVLGPNDVHERNVVSQNRLNTKAQSMPQSSNAKNQMSQSATPTTHHVSHTSHHVSHSKSSGVDLEM